MDPLIGEIRLLPLTFAPQDWLSCDGRLLPISQYEALFSIIGTTYGGDGMSNFAVPDLRGRVPVSAGQSPGTSNYQLGQSSGVEGVQLSKDNLPPHQHQLAVQSGSGTTDIPTAGLSLGTVADKSTGATALRYAAVAPGTALNGSSVGPGPGQSAVPHENRMPFLALQYCIACNGVYPVRP